MKIRNSQQLRRITIMFPGEFSRVHAVGASLFAAATFGSIIAVAQRIFETIDSEYVAPSPNEQSETIFKMMQEAFEDVSEEDRMEARRFYDSDEKTWAAEIYKAS